MAAFAAISDDTKPVASTAKSRSQSPASVGNRPPRSATAGAIAISAHTAPATSPQPIMTKLSAITIATSWPRPYPTAPSSASSRRRSRTFRSSTADRPIVPSSRPRPPSVWKVERYVFSTLWNAQQACLRRSRVPVVGQAIFDGCNASPVRSSGAAMRRSWYPC